MLSAACAVLALAGCGQNDVAVYEVPKEAAAPPPTSPQSPHGDPHAALDMMRPPEPAVTWGTLPEGWTQRPERTAMRMATFTMAGEGEQSAELAVIPMGSSPGTDAQLVNMWRSQLGLDALAENQAGGGATPVLVGGVEGRMYEMAGTIGEKPARMIVASVPKDGLSLFFKLIGDDTLVQSQKPAFLNFLGGLKFEAPAPVAAVPAAAPAASPTQTAANEAARWVVPPGWLELPPAQFLIAKFRVVVESGATADVNVSSLSGDGGGTLANINRWRGQLGLGPVEETALKNFTRQIEVGTHPAIEVVLDGKDSRTGQTARMLGIIIPVGAETWFFKMTGAAEVVDGRKDEFMGFVRSARL